MLAGDAMQALAFEVLTPGEGVDAALQARLCSLLARSAGHAGMAGGQAIDLASIGKPLDERSLRDMHRRKTGALLQASVLMGAACGDCGANAWAALSDYGAALGLAFQVVDDILDVISALAYFYHAKDLIDDSLPVLGLLDDAIMIELVVREMQNEISAYEEFCRFRSSQESLSGKNISREDWLNSKRREIRDNMRERMARRHRGGGGGRFTRFSFFG